LLQVRPENLLRIKKPENSGTPNKEEDMREELKTIIAAFLALFVVLSPAVHNMAQKPQITVPETTNTEIQPVEEVSLVGQQAPSLEMEYLHRALRRSGYRGEFKKISMRSWRNSASPLINMALPNSWFNELGLIDLSTYKTGILPLYYER
jgi:hypothetical protein